MFYIDIEDHKAFSKIANNETLYAEEGEGQGINFTDIHALAAMDGWQVILATGLNMETSTLLLVDMTEESPYVTKLYSLNNTEGKVIFTTYHLPKARNNKLPTATFSTYLANITSHVLTFLIFIPSYVLTSPPPSFLSLLIYSTLL